MERSRIAVFAVILFLAVSGLIARLFTISVIQHDAFVAKAIDQQHVERDILPRRGSLFVQDMAAGTTTVVAQSVERFALSATPRNVQYKAEFAAFLAPLLGLDVAKLQAGFERDSLYMDPFIHGLSKEQVEEVAAKINEFLLEHSQNYRERKVSFDAAQGGAIFFVNGTFFVREYQRVYPEGPLLGQLVGFVDDRGEGKYGLEGQYNEELRGYEGKVRLEKDSAGNLLRQNGEIQGQDGTSYELTIDRNIQQFIEAALAEEVARSEAKSGTVIVMDPKTGAIEGMASFPSYSPSDFRQVARTDITLFDNPAISKQWEPGSIFKPLVMAAALDQDVVEPDTKERFGASVTVDGYQINTALNKAFGEETMTDVIVNSDNVAMVWLADKLGNQPMADYLHRFGFGIPTGVELKNEIGGSVLPVERWRDIHRATMSFGQGIAVTPLQVITAYTAVANEGLMVKPRLVEAVLRPNGEREEVPIHSATSVLKPETAAEMRTMLAATVVHNHRRAGVNGYNIGGKTGTAQVPNPEGGGYLEGAYNHSFVGMGPIDQPRFVVLTKIDQPNIEKVGPFAESTAVPLFSRVANFLVHYYQIPPTNR